MSDTEPTTPAASRRWDRLPETDKDTRFFDLRAAGYTGWINQDGYATDQNELDHWLEHARNDGACPTGRTGEQVSGAPWPRAEIFQAWQDYTADTDTDQDGGR